MNERLYASVQSISDAKNVVKALASGPLKNFLRRIKKFGVATVSVELADAGREQWGDLGTALVRAMGALDKKCVLLVDEVPIFILELLRQDETGARARTFLNWYRKIRLDPETNRKIRWLLAGSIGVDTVTQRYKGYFDYWEQRLTEELGRPDDKQALDLLAAVAKNPEGESVPILKQVLSVRIQDVDERDQKLRYLLDVLQSDGYLVFSQERYRFRSPLLRDYWIRRLLP